MNSFRKHIKKKLSGYEPEVNDLSLHESWKQTERVMNKKNESRQRLNSFEPDVDDASLEEKWQAIIPYLPEEKKRRAVFYIPVGCVLPGVLLLIPALLFVLYYFAGFKEPSIKFVEKESSRQHHSEKQAMQQKHQPTTNTTTITQSSGFEPGSNIGSSNINRPTNSSKKEAYYHQLPGTSEHDIVSSIISETNVAEHLPIAGNGICWLYPVSCFPDRLFSDSLLKQAAINHDSVPAKKESRLLFDATVGMASMFSKTQFDNLPQMTGRKTGLCLSAALHYRLNKRLLLSGQLMAIDSRYEYRDESKKNFIIDLITSTSSSMPGSIDSTIKYMPFEKIHQLKSVLSWQAGVGMEVGLLHKNRFSLSAGLLLQLSMTQFRQTYSYQSTGDTLTYLKQPSSPPLRNTTKDTEPEMRSSTFIKTNLGVCPVLVIGYRIKNNVEVIIKPAAYFDVKELKPVRVSYNQNSFLLTGGIRIRL